MKKILSLMSVLVMTIAVGFTFAACDLFGGKTDENKDDDKGGVTTTYKVTVENTSGLIIHAFTPAKTTSAGTGEYTFTKDTQVTLQIRKSGNGYNAIEAEDYDVRVKNSATPYTGEAKDIQFTNMGQTIDLCVIEYKFTVAADITLAISLKSAD